MKTALLLVNPRSGKQQVKRELVDILAAFSHADWSVNVHVTRFPGDATGWVKEHAAGFDAVVACGGDGTLNEVVAGALESGFQGDLGFLPCGSTNDLAQTLHLPKSLQKAAEYIAKSTGKPLDFGLFSGNRYFTYIASFGAFTEVSYSTDQQLKNTFGHLAYVAEGIRSMSTIRPYRLTVCCDGVECRGSYIFGAAANSLSIGGVVKLQRGKIDLTDGKHEVILVKEPKSPAEAFDLINNVLNGELDSENIVLLHGKEITFSCDEEIPWCVDGEYAGKWEKATVKNLHDRLKVIY